MSIKINKFSKNYENEKVFEDFDLEMEQGEILELRGNTGAGKTTLKRCIAGLEDYEGKIEVSGELAYVFQDERTLPWLNVRKNILIPLKLKGESITEEKIEEMENLTEQLSVKEHLDKSVEEVSGGQLQRLLLIRALLTEPDLLILDEPFNSLDKRTRSQIYEEITGICKEKNISVLIASHTSDTHKFADRTIELQEHKKANYNRSSE